MKLVLIRHGESVGNVEGIWQGQMDFALTSKGVEQAELIAKWLANEEIDVLYSSDLSRAKHTAEKIAEFHGVEIQTSKLLREMNLGRFQGLTRQEVQLKYPDLVGTDWFQSELEDVEQIEQLYARARRFTSEILDKYKGKHVVAVSHGGFINALLMALLNIEWRGKRVFTVKNTSMTTIDFSYLGQVVIHGVNETPHLQGEQKMSTVQATI